MKQSRPNQQRGAISFGMIAIVIVVLVVLGGATAFMLSRRQAPTQSISDGAPKATTDDSASALSRIKNFYDCVEADGSRYQPGTPGSCVFQGKTFAEPAVFTEDSVRGAARLPADGRAPIYSLANKNFDSCVDIKAKDNGVIATTQVLSVLGSDFMYVGVSCSESYNVVFAKQSDDTWKNISQSADKISCSVVDQYKVPKELFTRSTDLGDHDATCRNTDGTARPIQYEYQPAA